MSATADLLVEIGCEELPPKALRDMALNFSQLLRAHLGGRHHLVSVQEEKFFCSPRRIAVLVPNVLLMQPDRLEPLTGPAEKAAFDAAGKPTKAAEGFAAKCGTTVDRLGRKDGKLFFERTVTGRPATEVVPAAVRDALDALSIPKRMRWGAGAALFARPVQWVVMLLGDTPIVSEVYGVESGRSTRGHRFHHPAPIDLKNAGDYAATLKSAKVWVNDATHALEHHILQQAQTKARATGGALLPDAIRDGGLISEIAALCEWPVVLEGRFDAKFLALPEELLISTLEGNQRYLLLRGPDGKLLPKFLLVTNLESKDPSQVVRGNERVIVPRLTDAMFFWDLDRQQPLAARASALEQVVFQKDLGSYAAKCARVALLAERIAGELKSDPAFARRAAELSKCDLLTRLVGEFPDLQGTIGRYLATHDGEPAEVATALEEQYRPRFAGDVLPSTRTGQVLALADKLDTLCGIFAIGQKPTGDKDPFGLRRAALGILRIIIEGKLDLDLVGLIEFSSQQIETGATRLQLEPVRVFILDRLGAYYAEQGIRPDVVDAVTGAERKLNARDIDERIKAVNGFLELPEWRPLAAANKRIANILAQAGGAPAGKVEAALLTEPAEQALYAMLESGEIAWIESLFAARSYDSALKKLAALKGPVDAFFDSVMVMAEDAGVRANRLRLLARVQDLFLHVADLGRLQVE